VADVVSLSPELLQHLRDSEKCVLHPYLDPVGYPTIGYGHRIASMDHPTLTLAEAEALLAEDVANYRAAALRFSPGLADEPQLRLDAITDFCFNAGTTAYSGSVLRLRVNQKMWAEAAAQIRRWVYATDQATRVKVKLAGLVKRREVCARWLEDA
jgi:lysozyme